jgi:hypothetical protein
MFKLLAILGLIVASSTATSATAAVDAGNKAKNASSAQKYCLQYEAETGTHLRRMDCRTKAEWKNLDVDVDALTAKPGRRGGQD